MYKRNNCLSKKVVFISIYIKLSKTTIRNITSLNKLILIVVINDVIILIVVMLNFMYILTCLLLYYCNKLTEDLFCLAEQRYNCLSKKVVFISI